MYKVLIADDEIKVCKLILNLVDWKSLGLEVIGTANDGIEALEIIEEQRPDIVITDIRMPGYDGIELIRRAKALNANINFIIVSGYRHFDYAHNAIKYGVEDYLLKPLKQSEITHTLIKMLEKKNMIFKEQSEHAYLKQIISIDTEKIKQNLLEILLNNPEAVKEEGSRESINKEYHCKFIEGYYGAAIIKPDIVIEGGNEETYELLATKTREIAMKHLQGNFEEILMTTLNEGILVVVNGTDEQLQTFKRQLKKIRGEVTSFRDLFVDVKVTFGLGEVVTDIKALDSTINNAKKAVINRLIKGYGHIIEIAEIEENNFLVGDFIKSSTRDGLLSYIDVLDSEGIKEILLSIKMNIQHAEGISGECILAICEELVEIFNFGIKKHYLGTVAPMNQKNYLEGLHRCSTINALFEYLLKDVEETICKIKDEKHRIDTQPIRNSKRYIKAHYQFPISLEEVSHEVGFNATYFSSLFKKETGQNFSEYLTEVRIKAAKQLLADTNKSILDVAEEVGYTDLKYFSKLFKKMTGLSPSEYRKLYY